MKVIGQANGQDVHEHTLDSGDAQISVMSLGAVIRDWRISGVERAMVLGWPKLEDHLANSRAHGTIAGRVANRTGFGKFTLNGVEHQLDIKSPPHHLHGGTEGLGSRIWQMEPDGTTGVRLTHRSPDGHMGYPGNVDFSVEMQLSGTKLRMVMEGAPESGDADQPSAAQLLYAGCQWRARHGFSCGGQPVHADGRQLAPYGSDRAGSWYAI